MTQNTLLHKASPKLPLSCFTHTDIPSHCPGTVLRDIFLGMSLFWLFPLISLMVFGFPRSPEPQQGFATARPRKATFHCAGSFRYVPVS